MEEMVVPEGLAGQEDKVVLEVKAEVFVQIRSGPEGMEVTEEEEAMVEEAAAVQVVLPILFIEFLL
jgi:hypothetical protein